VASDATRPASPIVYGYPYPVDFIAAERGLLELGGDVIVSNLPTWWCDKDQYWWDGPDPARAVRELRWQVESDWAWAYWPVPSGRSKLNPVSSEELGPNLAVTKDDLCRHKRTHYPKSPTMLGPF